MPKGDEVKGGGWLEPRRTFREPETVRDSDYLFALVQGRQFSRFTMAIAVNASEWTSRGSSGRRRW